MPARKSRTTTELTEGQAMYVLTRMVEDRRVSAVDLNRYVKEMEQEISTLEERLRLLRGAKTVAAATSRRAREAVDRRESDGTTTPSRRTKGRRKRRHPHLSPERRAELKLQGQYLALMRLSERKRAQYRKLFREQGLEATVTALRAAHAK